VSRLCRNFGIKIESISIYMRGGLLVKEYITGLIKEYVSNYRLREDSKTKWRDPVVGFASASDPMFGELSRIVCKEHIMPAEVLEEAQTVISYFIPFSKELTDTNKEGLNCSREWAAAYIETNKMIGSLNEYIAGALKGKGYDAKAADWHFDRERLLSDWSQRHVAFIAGLGTFGINNMLITGEGCCGRYGSIVTTLAVEPDVRPSEEYCLYKKNGSCGACVEHCVYGALKPHAFDRNLCYLVCIENSILHREIGTAEACGKCLTDVPCSFANPAGKGC
jgi:epoxyqueuosine reductase QueG